MKLSKTIRKGIIELRRQGIEPTEIIIDSKKFYKIEKISNMVEGIKISKAYKVSSSVLLKFDDDMDIVKGHGQDDDKHI